MQAPEKNAPPPAAEAVVIGGGVIGASVAYHLAKENIKAVVLERSEFASGSSGACEGCVFLQSKKPGLHLQMAMASSDRFSTLADELGSEIEYEKKGGLVIIETEEGLKAMQLFAQKQKDCGLNLSFLDRRQVREMEPALAENILGATFSPLEGQVNPFLLTRAFLQAAQRLGAQVLTHLAAAGLEHSRGRITAVSTVKGKIATDTVINAAGAYAPAIGQMVNLEIPIQPRRGQVLVTEAVPPLISHCLLSAKYIAAKFDPAVAQAGGMGFAVEQTANGNVLIGSTREFAGYDRGTTYEALNTMAGQILRVLPGLKDLHVIRAFAGLRPYTKDGLPILGRVEGVDGFIMAAGHEGDGITLSPVTGEIIAGLIAGKPAPFALDHFRLERFAETHD